MPSSRRYLFGVALTAVILAWLLLMAGPAAARGKTHHKKPPAPPVVVIQAPTPAPPQIDTSICSDATSCTYDPDNGADGGSIDTIESGNSDPGVPDLTPDLPTVTPSPSPQGQPAATGTAPTEPANTPVVPQIVTTPTTSASAAATTTTVKIAAKPPICLNLPALTAVPSDMVRNAATGTCTLKPPPPPCLNHPDYTLPLPQYWYQDKTSGNCFYRGPDAYGLCKGDQYNLVTYADVDKWLNDGYGMGIYIDGVPPDRHLNCQITDLATYGLNPKDFVFSGKYVQDGGPGDGPGGQPFGSPQPYPWSNWKPLYPYWVPRTTADQYVASQSTTSIQAYGLLWYGGHRYQAANAFSRYLTHNHSRWKTWKKQNPGLAAALLSHQRLLRRR